MARSTAVRYAVTFPAPHTHYAAIEAVFPTKGEAQIEVFLPVWTPGSYLVREYARHVEGIRARSGTGEPLAVVKSAKNRWRFETRGASEVHVSYSLYCREMSVRTNWVESSFAFLNGAPSFLTLVGGLERAHEVRLELPAEWETSVTGLDAASGEPHHYIAPDYDTLVDSPILAGNPVLHRFEVDGIPHCLVNQAEESTWDGKRAAGDVAKIVEEHRRLWGKLPYTKYVFLNLIVETGGGLEHKNSMCVMTNRWTTSTRRAYLDWLELVSHEFFHVWNVKRLRPVELGPFDYENENHTRSLWIAEGITDYYGPLAVRRRGLSTPQEYLTGGENGSGLSGVINRLQTTPGRLVQSAEEASFDAWIKLYRQDENTVNTTISYYTKGAVVAWLLDARIRKCTNGAKSLDDLMRLTFNRHAGEAGYTPEEFKAAAEEVAGTSLAEFFRRTVESTEELDYGEALEWFGLQFKESKAEAKKTWTGWETKTDNGRLVVTKLIRGTPAHNAGINVDDEILAIGDYRVRADQLSTRLGNYKPGDNISVLIARREKLMRIDVTLGEEPPKKWQLEIRPDASPAQRQQFKAWLGVTG
jgi:predicted metalloprotease with PDZ domain